MNSPLVSVYITNYNYGRFVQQAIESVLHQTYTEFELCIIDDGSTDNSCDIIESYSSLPNVNIIYQKNKGLNISNNIALRIAKGKYIMRLDADDYLLPNALEEMVSSLESDEEIALVFPDYYLVNENNERIGEVRRFNFRNEVTLPDLPAHGACTMIRKQLLLEAGGYDESFSCQDGYDLWIKFITRYKVENINKPLFHYRRHGLNLTENENKILHARAAIKYSFVQNNKIEVPPAVAIIPVRTNYVGGKNLSMVKIGGFCMLERTIRTALESKYLDQIIITSSDDDVATFCENELSDISDKVIFIYRPKKFSRYNESLSKSILHVLQSAGTNPYAEAIVTLAPEFPFLQASSIDDALHTLAIFNCDSLISVKSDTRTYYRHTGDGLKPILNQDKFTQFEREALYKAVGGVNVCRMSSFLKYKNMQCGKVGHVMIDNEQAHGIFNEFDLKVAELIAASKKSISEKVYN